MLNKSNLPKFNSDVYKKIALNDLVIYSIHYFQHDGAEITTEDIISACFLLFPRRFSLRNYPHWPDSAIVSRRWNECRIKGYIVGSAARGFKITVKGIKFAEKTAKKLGVAKPKPAQVTKVYPSKKVIKTRVARLKKKHHLAQIKKAPPVPSDKVHSSKIHPVKSGKVRQPEEVVKAQPKQVNKVSSTPVSVPKEVKVRAGKFVHLMERSDAYIHYKKNGKNSKIGEFDFRSLLLCTMESSRETLAKNVKLFKGYASIHNRQDLLTFLDYCEDKFSYLLVPPQKQLKKRSRERELHG